VLSAVFDGSSENPLLHFSESHLGTLGLCYFLAMRKREAYAHSAFKMVVLDDVLHSVDASHRGKAAELLKRELPSPGSSKCCRDLNAEFIDRPDVAFVP
jgi:wobble nucleotide-excising tRNase